MKLFCSFRLSHSPFRFRSDHTFLVCEQGKAKQLCNTEGFGFEMVKENVEVSGYRVAVVRKWVLDMSRLDGWS